MNDNNKKIVIFKSDCDTYKNYGEKKFVKFLDNEKTCAIFYMPLIGPKYLSNYLLENDIEEAYEIGDDKVLLENINKVYTFTNNHGLYDVNKGLQIEKKLVLLIDKGMDIHLNLPVYSYKIINDSIYIKPLKEKDNCYCYVAGEEFVNQKLRNIMTTVYEAVPGILSFVPYKVDVKIKTKKYNIYN